MVKLNNDWDELLKDEFQKEYYQNLREFLKQEYSSRLYIQICIIYSKH